MKMSRQNNKETIHRIWQRLLLLLLLLLVCLTMLTGCGGELGGVDSVPDYDTKALAINTILDTLPNGDVNSGFNAEYTRISDGSPGPFTLEEAVEGNFTNGSGGTLYLYAAYVDAQGTLSLLQLDLYHDNSAPELRAGETNLWGPGQPEGMETHPPLGWERVTWVATRNPVDLSGISADSLVAGPMVPGPTNMYASPDATALANAFVAAVTAANPQPEQISVVVSDMEIVPRETGPRYTWLELVGYYFDRGIFLLDGVFLESGISFESGSAELSDAAKAELDVWAEALTFVDPDGDPVEGGYDLVTLSAFFDAELGNGAIFEIGGHTDGQEAGTLGADRASAVYDYLTTHAEFPVDPAMLAPTANYSDSQPVERLDDSDRRVEIVLKLPL